MMNNINTILQYKQEYYFNGINPVEFQGHSNVNIIMNE